MNITLPDGSVISTDNIKRVSSIRDEGQDEASIDRSILIFTLKMRSGETIPVQVYYHYTDWAQKKIEITKLRNDILKHLDKQ